MPLTQPQSESASHVARGLLAFMPSRVLAVLGACVALVGAVFTLQGIGVLGGSFMSGSGTWAVIGIALVTAGLILYARASRMR
jgi:hypothetical protein